MLEELRKAVELRKAKALAIGTKKKYGSREYIKTAEGWKPVKKGNSPKPNKQEIALNKLSELPKGKLFDSAKNITSLFKKSDRLHNEVLYDYEQNKKSAVEQLINIKDIQITQPNVIGTNVERFIKKADNFSAIPAVKYNNSIVIPDGHHRLTATYLLGQAKIKVNLVNMDEKMKSIDIIE